MMGYNEEVMISNQNKAELIEINNNKQSIRRGATVLNSTLNGLNIYLGV